MIGKEELLGKFGRPIPESYEESFRVLGSKAGEGALMGYVISR